MKHPIKNPELEAAVLAVETDQSLNLQVPSKLLKTHPLVSEMSYDHGMRNRHNPRAEKIINRGYTLDFALGMNNLNRGRLIMDTFVKAVEQRGHEILNKDGKTFVLISGEELQIRLWEKSKYIEKPKEKWGYRDKELTGELFIQYLIRGGYVEKQWGDTAFTKLEDKLGRIIGSLEFLGKKEREERLEREAYWQEQRRKEDIRKELNSKKENEFKHFKVLLNQSIKWEKAQVIRAYISQIEASQESGQNQFENLQDWINWARSKADWYDPTVSAKDGFLNPVGDFHESLLEGKVQIDGYNVDKL